MTNKNWKDVPELPSGDVYFGGTSECCPRCESKNIEERIFCSSFEIDGLYCRDCDYGWAPIKVSRPFTTTASGSR